MLAGEQGEAVRDAIAYQIEVGRFGLDIVWTAIVVASVLGVASYLLMGALERRFVPASRT